MRKMVRILNNQNGVVMLMSLLVMALLTLVGMSALSTSDVELAIAANTKANKMAYYNGEAGLEYTRGVLQNSLVKEVFTNPDGDDMDLEDIDDGDEDSYITATYDSPDNFDFTTTVTISGTYPGNIFEITSVGKGPDNAETTILASFVRSMADGIEYGAFGDELVDMRANTAVYSYDSCEGETPTAGLFGGEGNVGSNNEVIMHDGDTVDGDVVLGVKVDGSQATLTTGGDQTISGDSSLELDEAEDSDPLGILSNGIFTTMADDDNNDNDLITGLVGTDLSIPNSGTLTLTSGDYYFTSITVGKFASLNIDTSSGDPVNIYLTGSLLTKQDANINTTGASTDFSIYSSGDLIDFKHEMDFQGLLYAPLATVEFHEGGDLYGAVIGKKLILHEGTTIYADDCLGKGDGGPAKPARLTQLWWKEVRN